MPDFNEFASTTLANLQKLVITEFQEHSAEAMADARDFLESSRRDLARWLLLQSEGQLTASDLAWLIQGKKDVARLLALKRAGVALSRLDQVQGALINIAIQTAQAGLAEAASHLAPAPTRSRAPVRKPAAKKKAPVKQAKAKAKAAP